MKKALDLKLPRGARVWLAYSGGVDSTMLLHLLASKKLPRFAAIHVHHGLQPQADAWARGCEKQCAALGVKCLVVRVQVNADDPAGPEAAARKARYAALLAQMGKDDLMLTAHHQDDQAETVLLRLLRGSGVEGLAAMRAVTPFGPGQLVRPLLDVPAEAIRDYARA
ncbi:MAG TPA: tRNA lysidine(34) synthetase TilS, partial [Nevskiaceae bacterium]|nr:tRNA lysidine(34) synthetase TilS [Nevskiaceae bacterium]